MATLPDLEQALRNADAAGDTAAARILAQEIVRMRSEGSPEQPETPPTVSGARTSYFPQINGRQIMSDRDPGPATVGFFDAVAGTVAPTIAGFGGPLVGAPVGAGGELAVQLRRKLSGEQPNVNWGEVVKSGATNAIPFSKAKGVIGALRNAGAQGTGGIAAEEARSLIDDGETSSFGENAAAGGIPAALAGLSPVAGKIIAKISGRSTPEDIVRAARVSDDMKAKLRNASKLIDAGGVLPPAELGDTSVKNWLAQQFTGKEFLQQQGSIRNEPVLRAKIRKDLKLGGPGPLNKDTIVAAETKAMRPYEQVAALSPNAATDFKALKVSRGKIRELEDIYRSSQGKNPALLDQIKAEKAKMEELEDMLEAHADAATNPKLKDTIDRYYAAKAEADSIAAKFSANESVRMSQSSLPNYKERTISQVPSSPGNYSPDAQLAAEYEKASRVAAGLKRRIDGRAAAPGALSDDVPPLIQEMREGRKTYAKAMQIQDAGAINYGRDQLNPQAIARDYEVRNGKANMSGGMKDVAEIAQAFPRETQATAGIGTPGVSRVNGLAAGQALSHGNPTGAVVATTLPFVGPALRDHLYSERVQRDILERALKGRKPKTTADPRVIEAILRASVNANRSAARK